MAFRNLTAAKIKWRICWKKLILEVYNVAMKEVSYIWSGYGVPSNPKKMTIKYYKWLQCKVTHNYFNDDVSSVFGLIPFRETAQQMNNYSIMLRHERNSFSFYIGKTDGNPPNVNTEFEGIADLYFQLVVSDYLFFNTTDLDINDQQKVLLLSNLSEAADSNIMHSGSSVSEDDTIKIRSVQFDYELPQGNGKLEITDEVGNVVLENEYSNDQVTTVPIDLQNLEVGKYTLSLSDGSTEEFFLIQETLHEECIGIVRINMEAMKANHSDDLTYEVKFEPRSIYWEYKIILRGDHTLLSVGIEGIDSETYSGPVEEDFMGNQKAHVFMSSIPRPMKQKHEHNPELTYTYSSENTDSDTLTLKLPIPGPEALKTKQSEEGEVSFYSTSIIYV